MILALVLPTKRSTFWSFSFGTLFLSISKRAHTQTLTSMVGTTSALRREHEQEFSKKIYYNSGRSLGSYIRHFRCCSRGDLLSFQEYYPVVYVWGDRCGREVPHFDSRLVSISDPRVGMTPLGLFGPEPDGNGPTTLACGPAAELTFVLLVWWLLPRRFLYAHQRTSRC